MSLYQYQGMSELTHFALIKNMFLSRNLNKICLERRSLFTCAANITINAFDATCDPCQLVKY